MNNVLYGTYSKYTYWFFLIFIWLEKSYVIHNLKSQFLSIETIYNNIRKWFAKYTMKWKEIMIKKWDEQVWSFGVHISINISLILYRNFESNRSKLLASKTYVFFYNMTKLFAKYYKTIVTKVLLNSDRSLIICLVFYNEPKYQLHYENIRT